MSAFKDRIGIRYGRLVVISFAGVIQNGFNSSTTWFCKCDCGKEIIVRGCHLPNGHTKSCGCLMREISSISIRKNHIPGKNHPCYIHGNRSGKATLKLNEKIRKRDNYTCQDCGKTQKEINQTLEVHHIDGDDENNVDENMITLCKSCHTKTRKGLKCASI